MKSKKISDPENQWSYKGKTGPKYWSCLSAKFASCDGRQQTPIDITESIKADLPPLLFHYRPFLLIRENNRHTLQVAAKKAGHLKIGDDLYQLLQFHFHSPSEEAIYGKQAEMVVHLVHQNELGEFAVVALLINVGNAKNPFIETLWNAFLKTPKSKQNELQIDLRRLLPVGKNYYTFSGSLTTPPCSEGVRWFVLKQAAFISHQQLAQYCNIYRENARPLQPLNGRQVFSSN